MSSSPYSEAIPQLIQEIDLAFTNQFGLIQPYQGTDYLPGDRYGLLDFQTYGADPERTALRSVRGGVEAKIIRGSLLISIALDSSGKDDQTIYREANTLFIQECLNIEHGLAEMHGDINSHQFVYELELDGNIDKATSVSLRDRTTWIVNVTAEVLIRLMVNRSIEGAHVLPLSQ